MASTRPFDDNQAKTTADIPGLGLESIILITSAVVFLLLSGYHATICFLRKSWLSWGMTLGAFLHTLWLLSYAYTSSMNTKPHLVLASVIPMFRLLSPTLIIIAIIQTFGRTAWYISTSDPRRLVKFYGFIRWNTIAFTGLVLTTFSIQSIGSVLTVASAGAKPTGMDTLGRLAHAGNIFEQVGLIIEAVFLFAFAIVSWRFTVLSKQWTVDWNDDSRKWMQSWRVLLKTILGSTLILIIHQIYEIVVAFTQPMNPAFAARFVASVPLLILLILHAIVHPSRCLPQQFTSLRLDRRHLACGIQSSTENKAIALGGDWKGAAFNSKTSI